ncbi:hypothetical protein ACU4GD_25940 [Cupriavidus basilensis]
MDMTQHIVRLGPCAVELVDRTMIDLAMGNPAFRPVIEQALAGNPRGHPAGGVRRASSRIPCSGNWMGWSS